MMASEEIIYAKQVDSRWQDLSRYEKSGNLCVLEVDSKD